MKAGSFFDKKPSFSSEDALETWNLIAEMEVFDAKGRPAAIYPQKQIPTSIRKAVTNSGQNPKILPIQFFRWAPDLVNPLKPAVKYLSSGTTNSSRSNPGFSQGGLELYKHCSLATFFQVIHSKLGDHKTSPGISLIPTRDKWHSSSLAHMMEWISEYCPVESDLSTSATWTQKGWVFGTGFHFVELYDKGARFPLPPHSIVIETGGTKGKTRSVTRKELHHMIREVFSISDQQIVSEYGMCELACQAYEFVDPSSKERKFQFPSWVKVQVANENCELKTQGQGALLIDDLARIDAPWPIQTQDLASISDSGRFTLLGRTPGSPLKGCSMNAEDLLKTSKPSLNKSTKWVRPSVNHSLSPTKLKTFFRSAEYLNALTKEFDSREIANWAIEDLISDIPDEHEWPRFIEQSYSKTVPEHCLLIPPQTHSIAQIYPLAIATSLGVKVSIRLRHNPSPSDRLLHDFFQSNGLDLKSIPDSFRLSDGSGPWDYIIAYGSSETIDTIESVTKIPVQGFGSILTVSISDLKKVPTNIVSLRRDLLSLANLGCLSSRAVFVVSEKDFTDFKAFFSETYDNACNFKLSPSFQVASRQSILDSIWQRDNTLSRNSDGTIFDWYKYRPGNFDLTSILCKQQYSFNIIHVSPSHLDNLKTDLSKINELRLISDETQFPKTTPIGESNRSPWIQSHSGEELFNNPWEG